jgi:hypothetical protein
MSDHAETGGTDARSADRRPQAATPPADGVIPAAKPPSAENRALAVALRHVREGQPPVITRIAKEVGCSASYLHRCKGFKSFLAAHQGDGSNLPRGRKDRETRDLEAWREDQ